MKINSFEDNGWNSRRRVEQVLTPQWMMDTWVSAGNADPRKFYRIEKIALRIMCAGAIVVIIGLLFGSKKLSEYGMGWLGIPLMIIGLGATIIFFSIKATKLNNWVEKNTLAYSQALWSILTLVRPLLHPATFPNREWLTKLIEETLVEFAARCEVYNKIDWLDLEPTGQKRKRTTRAEKDFNWLLHGAQAFGFIPKEATLETFVAEGEKSGELKKIRNLVLERDQFTLRA